MEKTLGGCIAGSDDCTYIRFDYPTIVDAPEDAEVDAINETIHSFLMKPLREDEAPASLNALMEQFLSDYSRFKTSEPRSVQTWFVERKVFVLRSSPNVVSFSLSERSYLGGAHGVETFQFVNLEPRTGRTVALEDILQQGAREKLALVAESRFRQVRGLQEGMTLKDAGFTFENDTFSLTPNFSLRNDGLAFYYNSYEVAPYALGPTEIVLEFQEIADLVKPEYVSS